MKFFTYILLFFLISEVVFFKDFWHSANGPSGGIVTSLAVDSSSSFIFVGTSNGGVYRSDINSNVWTQINSGLSNTDVKTLLINSDGTIFAGTFGGGIFISTNNGDSWNASNSGLTNPYLYSTAVSPNGNIYAGTGQRVFRSVNNGSSWTVISNGIPSASITSLAVNSSGYIFATTLGSGLYRSTNNGDLWIRKDSGIVNPDMQSVAIRSDGIIFIGTYNGVFRSLNNGDSYTRIDSGLTNVTAVYAFTFNSHNDIYLGKFSGGIYNSINSGNSWTENNSGLTNLNVTALATDSNGFIYAGTSGSGVFKSDNTITNNIIDNEVSVNSFELLQNYPNPFNPTTNLEYRISKFEFVTLKIYDVLGNEVAILVNENQKAGSYKINFNGSKFPSGIYIYKLTVNGISQNKKMILLK